MLRHQGQDVPCSRAATYNSISTHPFTAIASHIMKADHKVSRMVSKYLPAVAGMQYKSSGMAWQMCLVSFTVNSYLITGKLLKANYHICKSWPWQHGTLVSIEMIVICTHWYKCATVISYNDIYSFYNAVNVHIDICLKSWHQSQEHPFPNPKWLLLPAHIWHFQC